MPPIFEKTSAILEDCHDYPATLEKITQFLVSHLATWCLIDEVTEEGRIRRVAGAHQEISKNSIIEYLKLHTAPSPHATRGVYAAIQSGESFCIPDFTVERLSAWSEQESRAKLADLGADSYICVPLKARGQIIGSMTLIRVGAQYSEEDFLTAQEVARHFALALDNARMFRKMQEAVRVRDEFISIAAHEFRTPLMPLTFQQRVVSRIFDKAEPPDEQELEQLRIFVRTAGSQLGRLSRLVHDLMDTTLLTCQQIELQRTQVELSELLRDIIRDLRDSFRDADCKVELRVREECTGLWDRHRLERAIINLLTNATKFGAGKPIIVTLGTVDKSPGAAAFIQVQDHGIGISPEDQARIFRAFERGNVKRSTQGVGLGLYIVQQIVAQHLGTVQVQSVQGEGAAFTVELPRQENSAVHASEASSVLRRPLVRTS
jgi:signal transduction histidine kinase